MRVIRIAYPEPLSQIKDPENSNIDVIVQLEDGKTYTVVVSTPKNYYWYMDKEEIDYYCGVPDIIVRRLTEEIIEKAINVYADGDAYWLKFYHLAGELSINRINEIIEEDNVTLEASGVSRGENGK